MEKERERKPLGRMPPGPSNTPFVCSNSPPPIKDVSSFAPY